MTNAMRLSVLAATLLLAGVLALWSLVTPSFRAPDEPTHASTIVRLATQATYPSFPTATVDDGVRSAGPWLGFPGLSSVFDAGPVPPQPLALEPGVSLAELRTGDHPRDPETFDQMTQHPPAYYFVMAGAYRLLGLDDRPVDVAVLSLRLISASLLLPLPWIIASTGLALKLPAGAVAASTFVPAAWIQFVHIGASVTNGALLVLAASAVILFLIRVRQGDMSAGVSVGLGLSLTTALLTKGFALALLPLVLLAFVGAWTKTTRERWVRSGLLVVALALPGLSWWVANIIRLGTIQPTTGRLGLGEEPAGGPVGVWLSGYLDSFSSSLWADLGWAETPLPNGLHAVATTLLVVILALGSWRLRTDATSVLILFGAIVGPVAISALGSWTSWTLGGYVAGAWGRYTFSGVVGVAALVAAAAPRSGRWLAAVPLVAALLASAGLTFGMRHFWQPASPATALSWWPAAELLVGLAGLAVLAGCVVGFIGLNTFTRADRKADVVRP